MLVFVAVCRLSLAAASEGYSVVVFGLLTAAAALLLRSGALGHMGSVDVEHGLSCSMTRGIFSDQGLNHTPCNGR